MRSLLATVLLFPAIANAQLKLDIPDMRPRLMVSDGEVEKPLSLAKADIRIVVTGYLAQTTMTLTFKSTHSRVMEGELEFPLPEGATVSGYGLDVNGVIVDGVPVERTKARITFEKEVRKGVDPGLVEHVRGSNFRTRIYPIPANGERTVKVQYVSELTASKEGPALVVPMNWGNEAVGEYHIKVELVNPLAMPVIRSASANLEFSKVNERVVLEKTYQNAKLTDDLTIVLPNAPTQHVAVEKYQPTGTNEAQYFFVIDDQPPVVIDQLARKAVGRVGILWDASLSRAEGDKTREIELVRKVVERLGDVPVDVILFSNTADTPVTFAANKPEKLIAYLQSVIYDGGTDLGRVQIRKNYWDYAPTHSFKEAPANYDYWLLFSDGLGNLGKEVPQTVEAPVYAISNDARADHTLLSHLAETSGGRYLNLKRMSNEEAVGAIGQSAFSCLSIECSEGQIGEVFPRGVKAVMGRLTVAGKLLSPQAKVTIRYGYRGQETSRSTFVLSQGSATQTGLVARFWGQQKLAELSVFAEKNHDELLKVGREFSIVTPNTSLMVLERLEQYVQYGIEPPASLPQMHKEYLAQMLVRERESQDVKRQKIDQVLAMWNGRVKWWEADYKYPAGFKYVEVAGKDGGLHPVPAPGVLSPRPAEVLEERVARLADPQAAAQPMQASGGAGFFGNARGGAAAEQSYVSDLNAVNGTGDSGPSITLKAWDPDTPYLAALRAAKPAVIHQVYLKQREKYATSPAFYLDCAEFFLQKNQREIGIRILTDIAELQLQSAPLLRIVAHRLNQIGERDLAIDLFEKVLKMRPEEPQSFRDLALALIDRADAAASPSPADYTRALGLLHEVVMKTWDRFPEIEVVALMEANRLIDRMKKAGVAFLNPFDARLVKLLDLDVRIILTWDADLTDIDLWVTEPSGEKVFYSHNRSTIGGLVSADFTQGYGPEEYCLRRAMPGEYKIQCNFYGSSQQSLSGPTTVQATVITNFGKANEKREAMTVRLTEKKEVVEIGVVRVDR